MTKLFREVLEDFKQAWDTKTKEIFMHGEDLKKAQQVSKYLWRKARQDMVDNRDIAIDQ